MTTMDKVREEIAKIDKDRLHLVEAYMSSQVVNRLCSAASYGFALQETDIPGYSPLGEENFDDLELIAKQLQKMISHINSEESYAFHYGLSLATKELCDISTNTTTSHTADKPTTILDDGLPGV